MKNTAANIAKLKEYYRVLCQTHDDPKVQRIAQTMEITLIWATQKNCDYPMLRESNE